MKVLLFSFLKLLFCLSSLSSLSFFCTGVVCFNPGSFSQDYTFVAYYPSSRETEFCKVRFQNSFAFDSKSSKRFLSHFHFHFLGLRRNKPRPNQHNRYLFDTLFFFSPFSATRRKRRESLFKKPFHKRECPNLIYFSEGFKRGLGEREGGRGRRGRGRRG